MIEISINLDLFGPFIRGLYDDHLVLGFGIKQDAPTNTSIYYVVDELTAAALMMRVPPGAIIKMRSVSRVLKADRVMSSRVYALKDEETPEMPEIVLDFIE